MEDFSEATDLRMSYVRPVLTAEEWARAGIASSPERGLAIKNTLDMDDAPDFHGAAALALYGQPFGFTQEDVKDERNAERDCMELARQAQDRGDELERYKYVGRARRHKEPADRIEALLPPATA